MTVFNKEAKMKTLLCAIWSLSLFLFPQTAHSDSPWENDNPIVPIPNSPLGIDSKLSELPNPPTPERVRLGRWLFYDKRLSADGTVSCATCHRPENAFSEPTPVSTGIQGKKGGRKAPSFVNLAWTLYPHFFWDGRAKSLEEQALGPVQNPIEMGSTVENLVKTLNGIKGYRIAFKQAFGSDDITAENIAKAIADYERTRLSGNSPYDRWKAGDEKAVSAEVKKGDDLFFGKAQCNNCHLGQNFTDNLFHNLGIGWNAKEKKHKDEGRFKISAKIEDMGAFKTPTIREVNKHAPFMHDGSLLTLEDVVEHYNKGGNKNPQISPKLKKLGLTKAEVRAIVAMMKSLEGEGYQDKAPASFPQ